jgi:cysteine desulfurase / selenocysteine lyase
VIGVAHVSNVFGPIYPVAEIEALAKKHGVAFFVDGAQAAPHVPVDVAKIGCDFYAFSAHKNGRPDWSRRSIRTPGVAGKATAVSSRGRHG